MDKPFLRCSFCERPFVDPLKHAEHEQGCMDVVQKALDQEWERRERGTIERKPRAR